MLVLQRAEEGGGEEEGEAGSGRWRRGKWGVGQWGVEEGEVGSREDRRGVVGRRSGRGRTGRWGSGGVEEVEVKSGVERGGSGDKSKWE